MTDLIENVISFVLFFGVVFIGFVIGSIYSHSEQMDKLIDLGVAGYKINEQTGEVKFIEYSCAVTKETSTNGEIK